MPAGYAAIGGTNVDLVITEVGPLVALARPPQTFTLWTSKYGGTQYTDTLNEAEQQTNGVITMVERGRFPLTHVRDTDGTLAGVWVEDGDGDRAYMPRAGKQGPAGPPGNPGPPGPPGESSGEPLGVVGITLAGTDAVTVEVDDDTDTITIGQDAVPPGGTAGQALVKASGGDFDTAWSDVASGGGGVSISDSMGQVVRSGRAVGLASNLGTFTVAVNTLYARPVRIRKGGVINSVSLWVNTAAAGSSIRVGIYAHDPATDLPGTLVREFGTIDTTATGQRTLTLSPTFTLPDNSVYWLACVAQGGTPNIYTHGGPEPLLPLFYALAGYAPQSLTRGGISGALPSPMGWTGGSNNMPAMFLHTT